MEVRILLGVLLALVLTECRRESTKLDVPGSTPGRGAAGMEQRRLAGLITLCPRVRQVQFLLPLPSETVA